MNKAFVSCSTVTHTKCSTCSLRLLQCFSNFARHLPLCSSTLPFLHCQQNTHTGSLVNGGAAPSAVPRPSSGQRSPLHPLAPDKEAEWAIYTREGGVLGNPPTSVDQAVDRVPPATNSPDHKPERAIYNMDRVQRAAPSVEYPTKQWREGPKQPNPLRARSEATAGQLDVVRDGAQQLIRFDMGQVWRGSPLTDPPPRQIRTRSGPSGCRWGWRRRAAAPPI